ncbi:MAG: hypothetical protein Q8O82_02010 [Pseudorhodobacter sp.]|nr:hypothetical protein [Pseudorhodobacter sp.]
MTNNHAGLIVIGAAPGGYACAFRVADMGRNSVLVESPGNPPRKQGAAEAEFLRHDERGYFE